MSINRCIYCGRYGQKMANKECQECLRELRAIKEKTVAKKPNNVIPFRVVEVEHDTINQPRHGERHEYSITDNLNY